MHVQIQIDTAYFKRHQHQQTNQQSTFHLALTVSFSSFHSHNSDLYKQQMLPLYA